MRDTKGVNESRGRRVSGALALPLFVVLLAISVACASRAPVPSVPTLPKPTPPSRPAPSSPTSSTSASSPSTTSSTSSTSPAKEAPAPSSVPGKPDGAVPESGEQQDESSGSEVATAEATGKGTTPGPRTTEEEKQALEGDLDDSLSEFDRMLLREQEILAEERAAQASASGNGASEIGETGGGASGGSLGEEGATQTADASSDAGTESGTGGSPDTPAGEASEAGAPVGGKDEAESTNGRIPPDVGDGKDDDIVARQLREAAMKEEDPVLREKLWDEYRAYKKGTSGGNN